MKDKLHDYFSENEFDFHEPRAGHMERFEKRLSGKKQQNKLSWKWIGAAASVVLLIGFMLGSISKSNPMTLSSVSPKMQEVENYFVNTINVEIKEIEKERSLETEKVIENALDQIEELEDNYKIFVRELGQSGDQSKIISEMIKNYQKRLDILQTLLEQIEQIKNPKILDNEVYI